MKNVNITADPDTLADVAAELFIARAQFSIKTQGRFSVALSGGSTPRDLYTRLAAAGFSARIDWKSIHLFWGDERCVPPDHADSNYRMVAETLLANISIPANNIHRIQGELSPDQAASQYETELRAFFAASPDFDLVLLGLGDDGHTASIFPSSPALRERTRWVAAVSHETPPPPLVPRVTLTPIALNAARYVVFLVSGSSKAKRLAEILRAPGQPDLLPAQAIQPVNGQLLWLIDQAASANL